jgi:membrane protein DedA with SNARE-associated domain
VVAASPQWQRLIVLVPAFIIGGGIIVAALMLLARAFGQYVRESEHKRWIYASIVAVIAVTVLVTYLGIKLPREG